MADQIEIIKAREHNLKNVSLTIPHHTLTVMSGVSGSGKSSLAFDTIFKEGQRRYLESLSSYARQFLGVMSKADVDHIEGLSPTISIDQKSVNKNPRSTVGTVTELYDFLRLMFARLGIPHCSSCGTKITKQSEEQIARTVLLNFHGENILVLAPIVMDRKGEYRKELDDLKTAGFIRARVDGAVLNLEDGMPELKRYEKHTIEAVIDRIAVEEKNLSRIVEAIERATALTKGLAAIYIVHAESKTKETKGKKAGDKTKMQLQAAEKKFYHLFTTERSCAKCGHSIPAIEPNLFSFNNPAGACPSCSGLGIIYHFNEELIVGDKNLSMYDGALKCFVDDHIAFDYDYTFEDVEALARQHKISLRKPWKEIPLAHRKILLYGGGKENSETTGIAERLKYLYETYRIPHYENFMEEIPCKSCGGSRLNGEALSVKFDGKTIADFSAMTIDEAKKYFDGVTLAGSAQTVGEPIIKEIRYRLTFLEQVGLTYLTINRASPSLSGGESQRIRLAAQIGSGLEGVLYVLDEPSIGLHQSDNKKLLASLKTLRDKHNTVIVVEHDEETIQSADYLVDIGPGAGVTGGEIVGIGSVEDVKNSPASITGRYLRGDDCIKIPEKRRAGNGTAVVIRDAHHNNLNHVDASFPLGTFIAVTGVSGSGKSTLIDTILKRALFKRIYKARMKPGKHEAVEGIEHIDKVIEIDQSPIGRTPRSNPATYTKVLTPIRDLFANTNTAKMRGYTKSRFSFNVAGGRCPTCEGAGVVSMEMQFLSDVLVPCEECNGKRFNAETLDVEFKGKTITDVLAMSVNEAYDFFENIPSIRRVLETLREIGLGYIALGQPSTTLSGGEAQRMKLASELYKTATGKTLYLLDEPTTGLHFEDIKKLLHALQSLVDKGNTVIVIEHNLDVIKSADHIIDLGPGGGKHGGRIIATGTPEAVAKEKESLTGKELKAVLYPDKRTAAQSQRDRSVKKQKEIITVTGAKKHNLKNISLTIPKNTFTVITGLSGSGKTSLAFDTIFKEGQRRFVESLSTYARRFLGRFENTDVDRIEGLSPAIAIDQKNVSRNPRSTVATVTEIYDYLRLLYARIGVPYCPECGTKLTAHSPSLLGKEIAAAHAGEKCYIIAPLYDAALKHRFAVPQGEMDATHLKKIIETARTDNFMRLVIDKDEYLIEDINDAVIKKLCPSNGSCVQFAGIVIDRIIPEVSKAARIAEALTQAFSYSEGVALIRVGSRAEYVTKFPACLTHGILFDEEVTPRHFSFNSHWGQCPACKGIGSSMNFDPSKVIIDGSKPFFAGALHERLHRYFIEPGGWLHGPIARLMRTHRLPQKALYETPFIDLSEKIKDVIFNGDGVNDGMAQTMSKWYNSNDLMKEDYSEYIDDVITQFLTETPCPECKGMRLTPKILAFRVDGRSISETARKTVAELAAIFGTLSQKLSDRDNIIVREVIQEIGTRVSFLEKVGLSYISLDRRFATLSGGESQRIRLASQLGSRLTGVLYVLDEPTVGLHPRDTDKLLATLKELRDLKNTLIVVEHDRETIDAADHIIDMGPAAGERGGEVMFNGGHEAFGKADTLTARYMRGDETIGALRTLRPGSGSAIVIRGARLNNLKNINARIPLNTITTVTGVSGSGKSSLVVDTIYAAVRDALNRRTAARDYDALEGLMRDGKPVVQNVILVDQMSIGGSIRSTLATYLKIFDRIRAVYAKTELARVKGYTSSRFTYNGHEGRCKSCDGKGIKKITMHFLSDLEVVCDECKGKRYNSETLAVTFKGRSIADVFAFTVDEAAVFFENHRGIRESLTLLSQVGLGYVKLGQRLDTLSGGELQRLKLSRELARGKSDHTLYVLDEPTTGLHFDDVKKLIAALDRLVDNGNSVLMVEHNPDVMRNSDHLIDLGPEGGNGGGTIVAEGTPDAVKALRKGFTWKYL
ncbi:MAG: excinuclease ABC subunit UvrA [Spirochaetes bacterium]|nr:excinuclease ABC subunit UvrA [Spirochaetota bacterium]